MRQANAVILQLKREQQALFLHLLLLKKKLKEQEALAASVSEVHQAVLVLHYYPYVLISVLLKYSVIVKEHFCV